jgi:hypothetical protein
MVEKLTDQVYHIECIDHIMTSWAIAGEHPSSAIWIQPAPYVVVLKKYSLQETEKRSSR